MLPEQGAQAAGENSGGALQGGDTAGNDAGQYGLSNAPQGRREGGVEPRSPVLGNEKQSCLQEGATVVANPMGEKVMSACNAPESTGTPLGGTMPEGTAGILPNEALMSALCRSNGKCNARGTANKDESEYHACGHAWDGCKSCIRIDGHTPGGDDVRGYCKFVVQ